MSFDTHMAQTQVAPVPGTTTPPEHERGSPGTDPPRIDPEPRPHRNLLIYYALGSLLLGPFFWALLIPRYFRYHTLRYRFDDEGVTMRWGVLFRREISLTYARIQDIHLTSNVVERWLGLARIQIQTASGSASAEMTIEGLQEFERVRDFLYSRMRGAREHDRQRAGVPVSTPAATGTAAAPLDAGALDELTRTLRAVAEEVRALRTALPAEPAPSPEARRG